jgi:hypothetical protein
MKPVIQSFPWEIYIPAQNKTAQGFIQQMLWESAGQVLGYGDIPGYFVMGGILPDLALVRKGFIQAAAEHGAVLRMNFNPNDTAYPPEVQAHLDSVQDLEESWYV